MNAGDDKKFKMLKAGYRQLEALLSFAHRNRFLKKREKSLIRQIEGGQILGLPTLATALLLIKVAFSVAIAQHPILDRKCVVRE